MGFQRFIFLTILPVFFSSPAWGMICSVELVRGYTGLFKLALNTPHLTPERAAEILNSPTPIDPLATAPRTLQTHALKQRFRQLLPRLTPESWRAAQENLREHMQITKAEAVQVEAAVEASRLIFAPSPTPTVSTPKIPLHGSIDRQVTWADRGHSDRLYFVGTEIGILYVFEEKTRKVHNVSIGANAHSTIQIHRESPVSWRLIFAGKNIVKEWSVFTLELNPKTLDAKTPEVLAGPGLFGQDSRDFQEIRNLDWIVSPDGKLNYTYTNSTGTWIGAVGSKPKKLNYEVDSGRGVETVPSSILTMKGGRVLMATLGLNREKQKCLMVFEPLKSLDPIHQFHDPEIKYYFSPDLIQFKGRVYAAAVGYTDPRSEQGRYVDVWDVSGGGRAPRASLPLPGHVIGPPRFFATAKGRLLLANRLEDRDRAFSMMIFEPLVSLDPVYDLSSAPSVSPQATPADHFPKLVENHYGELLVAGISRIDHMLYIYRPEHSTEPVFSYDFHEPYSLSPAWSAGANGKLDLIFADPQGKTHFINVMQEEEK